MTVSSPRPHRSSAGRVSPIHVRQLVKLRPLPAARLKQAVLAAAGGRDIASLSVAVVDDRTMARLHGEFMNDPTATDVLTFDLRDDLQAEAIEGEIVVSFDTARREAARRRLDVSQELLRYIVHGVLHLMGLDDKTGPQRRRMRREEDRVLARLQPVRVRPRTSRSAARPGRGTTGD